MVQVYKLVTRLKPTKSIGVWLAGPTAHV